MDAFGIEKEVEMDAKSSAVGGVGATETSKATTGAIADQTAAGAQAGEKLTTAKVTIKALVNGVQQDLTFDIDK